MLAELPELAHIDAKSIDEAIHWLTKYGDRAAVIAGGTDLLGLMKDRITGPKMPQPEVLVNIKTIPELTRITTQPNGDLRIGASVILQDLEECPKVVASFPMLVEAAASVATTQIRAMGTVGGNLCQRPWCWYFRHPQFVCYKRGGKQCFAIPGENSTYFSVLARGICVMSHPSDLAPALMALSARIGAAGPSGRRDIPIGEFFQGPRSVPETKLEPGEIITWIDVPAPSPSLRTAFIKHRVRKTWDFALSEVAVALTMSEGLCNNAHIILGGVAPYPYRVVDAESVLNGRAPDEALINEAAEIAVKRAKGLTMNGYKIGLTKALVRRALTTALQ
jgi:xanthine dehydrogenase YagS FAD-binding subunit